MAFRQTQIFRIRPNDGEIGNRRWIPGGIANTLEVLDDSLYALRIAQQENKLRQFPPEVLIRPDLPKNVNSIIGYGRVEKLIAAGERAIEEQLDRIIEISGI